MLELETTNEMFNLVLRHSARSVLKWAPQVNKIHIVIYDDNQITTCLKNPIQILMH